MPRVRSNVLVNFLGRGWSAAVSLALVPLYIHFLGIEAYGLVGFLSTLQALASLLDLGFSATLNRELARRTAQALPAHETRDLVRTLELIYWSMGILVGIVVLVLAPLLARRWIHPTLLPVSTVSLAIAVMGFVLAIQFPLNFYAGGIMGLQRQAVWNALWAGFATFRGVGAIVILWKVSPTIVAFFLWQIASGILQTSLAAFALWRSLPAGGRPRFRARLVAPVWRFAAGMTGITAVTLLLTQLDKVILSRMLPLGDFGYYALAGVVATGLYILILPVYDALFPRFSELVARQDIDLLRRLYHSGCQFLAVVILPAAAVVAFCAPQVLFIWTGNSATVEHTARLVTILIAGTALNGLMNVPYALQLAHGWTKLTLIVNSLAVLLLAPATVLMAARFGGPGAALVWLILNAGYVLVVPHILHRRLLVEEKRRWYLQDVLLPLCVSIAVAGAGRSLMLPFTNASRLGLLLSLGVLYGVVLVATAAAVPVSRNVVIRFFQRRTQTPVAQ